MARNRITDLKPRRKFRKPKRAGTKAGEYNRILAVTEDSRRPRLIWKTIKTLKPADRKSAKRLAKRLKYTGAPPKTLASAAHHYDLREPFLDHLIRIAWKVPCGELVFATLLPRRSRKADIAQIDPYKFLDRLRQDVRRSGGATAKGWLVAGIHAEFDSGRNLYDPHYHVLVCGPEMIAVIERLRARGKYRLGTAPAADGLVDRAPPIRMLPIERSELRYTLGYLVQSYVPQHRTAIDETGTQRRSGRRRITGIRHTETLLWLDRQQLHRMVLLYRLEVGRKGLRVKNP